MKIIARRTISFTTETDMSSYPGMTQDQAVEYEKSLELADVVELIQFSENVDDSVEVTIVG